MAIYEQGTPLGAMEFQPGDACVVEGKATLSGIIRYLSKGRASHAILIVDQSGYTIEALSTIRNGHMRNYVGQNVLIVRPRGVSEKLRHEAIDAIELKWMGKRYPWWRLGIHIVDQILPTFGRINLLGIPVCSEVVTYDEWKMGIRSGDDIWGVNPNELMNYWVMVSQHHDIVYRGRLVK